MQRAVRTISGNLTQVEGK
jgi:septal ring factor EnvC (AmiA/AmiB activator)